MSDSETHSEHIETSVTSEGGETTEHHEVTKDGEKVVDETKKDGGE